VIARRRYGDGIAPFVARQNGALGTRAVGHGGGWGHPTIMRNRVSNYAIRTTVANHCRRRSDRARGRFVI
jgi:hypothetical protein